MARLAARGQFFTSLSASSRSTIAASIDQFIHAGHRILVHGLSRCVITALRHAATQSHKQFSVITTEARPLCDGYRLVEELTALGIATELILDSAVACCMERVDLVLVGAEGVAESGGIINKVGTFTVCAIASMMGRPVYVCAECYKFSRIFPLSQRDVPERRQRQRPFVSVKGEGEVGGANAVEVCRWPRLQPGKESLFTVDNVQCDYTPPQYLTLLFTDLGILDPSAISDELIKLML